MNINRRSFLAGLASGSIAGVLGSLSLTSVKKSREDATQKRLAPNFINRKIQIVLVTSIPNYIDTKLN